jgi:hypothetical protein
MSLKMCDPKVSNPLEYQNLVGQSTDNQVEYKNLVENTESRLLVIASSSDAPKAQCHLNYQQVVQKQAVQMIAIKKNLSHGKVGQAIRDKKITREYGHTVAKALLFELRTQLPSSHRQYDQQYIPLDDIYRALDRGLLASAVRVGRINEVRAAKEALISLPSLGLDFELLKEIFRKHVPRSIRPILTEK